MSGVGAVDGTAVRAGDDGADVDALRRGEGGYNGEAVAGNAGGGTGGEASVQQRIAELERKIKEVKALEKKVKELEKKLAAGEGSVEFVDSKQMRPNILKEGWPSECGERSSKGGQG